MALALARHSEGFFANARAQKLFFTSYFPEHAADGVKGVVIFMHGINEHCHRFKHVYEVLVSLGFGVIAYDMVSHGKSDCDVPGLRGHSEKFQNMVDDTNAFLEYARTVIYPTMLPANQQQPPLYFMGISYGCLVGLHTILSGQFEFSGVVLAAPALGVEQTFTLRLLGLLAAPFTWAFPLARIVPGVNFDGLSRNPEFVKDYLSDELNTTENMTARMGTLTLEAMQALLNHPTVQDPSSAFCKLPVLLIQGTADIVTSVDTARSFFNKIGNSDKQMKEYEGFYHCLFNEPEKDQVLGDVTNWLLTRAAQTNQ